MSESAIREQIKTILTTVSTLGPVHKYERWTRSFAKFMGLMRQSDSAPVNGWMISRRSADEHQETVGMIGVGGTNIRQHIYEIKGIYALNDEAASSLTFEQIIEDVCTAFRPNKTINGTCQEHDFVQINDLDVDDFDTGTLYHTAMLELTVREQI